MDTSALTSASLMTHTVEAANGLISAFDVSSHYQNVIFGDEAGCCHLYSATASARDGNMMSFNPYSQETQFADVVSILSLAPLSSISHIYSARKVQVLQV